MAFATRGGLQEDASPDVQSPEPSPGIQIVDERYAHHLWQRSTGCQSKGSQRCYQTNWTYPDLTDTLGLDLHFAAEVNSAVAGMAALALLCISFSKLMGDF